jgi:cytochrome b6-f complex iron-sulfur subunit
MVDDQPDNANDETIDEAERERRRQTSRRDVLRTGWKIGGALLIGAAAYTGYEALRPLAGGAGGAKISVGDVANFPKGSSTYVPAGRLYVVNADNHLFALSQKCPHLGCKVPYCDSSGRFECPCHGSVFDLAGEYIKGPAPHGMDQYPLSLDGTTVVVDTRKVITGPDRGVNNFLTPPKGPSCIGKA